MKKIIFLGLFFVVTLLRAEDGIDKDLLTSKVWIMEEQGIVMLFDDTTMKFYHKTDPPILFEYTLDKYSGKLINQGQSEDIYFHELTKNSLILQIGQTDSLKLDAHREEGFVYGRWKNYDGNEYIFDPDHTIIFKTDNNETKAKYYFHSEKLYIIFDDRLDAFVYATNDEKTKMSLYSSVIEIHLSRED